MPLSKNLRKERSQSISLQTVTFNAPGVYYPPYGKSVFELSGRGSPGNTTVPSTVSGSNSNTYYYYQPPIPGDLNYNYGGMNGYYQGGQMYEFSSSAYGPIYGGATETGYGFSRDGVPGPVSTPDYTINFYAYGYSYYEPPQYPSPILIPGNYNPDTPGYPASYTNPGNPNYNTAVPGTAGANSAVLGIPLPGGAADTAAPVIGYSAVQVSYVTAGVPISVPPGGYVVIRNKLPNT
jgi:hypothetical protein